MAKDTTKNALLAKDDDPFGGWLDAAAAATKGASTGTEPVEILKKQAAILKKRFDALTNEYGGLGVFKNNAEISSLIVEMADLDAKITGQPNNAATALKLYNGIMEGTGGETIEPGAGTASIMKSMVGKGLVAAALGSVAKGAGRLAAKLAPEAAAAAPQVAKTAEKAAENPGWWAKVTDPKRVAKGIAGATLVGAAGSAGLVGVQATYNKMRDITGVQGREDQKILAQQQGQTDLARIAAEDTANQKIIAGKIELGKEKLSNEQKMNEAKLEMLKGQMNAATAIFQNSATQAINYLPRMPSDLYSGLGIAPLPQYAQPTQQPSMAP